MSNVHEDLYTCFEFSFFPSDELKQILENKYGNSKSFKLSKNGKYSI